MAVGVRVGLGGTVGSGDTMVGSVGKVVVGGSVTAVGDTVGVAVGATVVAVGSAVGSIVGAPWCARKAR